MERRQSAAPGRVRRSLGGNHHTRVFMTFFRRLRRASRAGFRNVKIRSAKPSERIEEKPFPKRLWKKRESLQTALFIYCGLMKHSEILHDASATPRLAARETKPKDAIKNTGTCTCRRYGPIRHAPMSDTGPEPQEAAPPPEAPAPAAPAQPSDPPDAAPVAKPRKLIKAVWNPEVRPRAPASPKNLRIPGFFHGSRTADESPSAGRGSDPPRGPRLLARTEFRRRLSHRTSSRTLVQASGRFPPHSRSVSSVHPRGFCPFQRSH